MLEQSDQVRGNVGQFSQRRVNISSTNQRSAVRSARLKIPVRRALLVAASTGWGYKRF